MATKYLIEFKYLSYIDGELHEFSVFLWKERTYEEDTIDTRYHRGDVLYND